MRAKAFLILVAFLVLSCVASHADTAVKCTYKNLGSCPKIGCAKPGTLLAATNSLKRTTAINGSPSEISFADLGDLQTEVDKKFANGKIVITGR